MKRMICIALLLTPLTLPAQFKSASIIIDGLTCSMCSYSVERSIKKLKFIDSVSMDLNTNVAFVAFKSGSKVDVRSLIKSIRDAGFTVRSLTALFIFRSPLKITDSFFWFEEDTFIVLDALKEKNVQGMTHLKFIEKTFSEPLLYKKYRSSIEKFSSDHFTNSSYYVVFI